MYPFTHRYQRRRKIKIAVKFLAVMALMWMPFSCTVKSYLQTAEIASPIPSSTILLADEARKGAISVSGYASKGPDRVVSLNTGTHTKVNKDGVFGYHRLYAGSSTFAESPADSNLFDYTGHNLAMRTSNLTMGGNLELRISHEVACNLNFYLDESDSGTLCNLGVGISLIGYGERTMARYYARCGAMETFCHAQYVRKVISIINAADTTLVFDTLSGKGSYPWFQLGYTLSTRRRFLMLHYFLNLEVTPVLGSVEGMHRSFFTVTPGICCNVTRKVRLVTGLKTSLMLFSWKAVYEENRSDRLIIPQLTLQAKYFFTK